MKLLYSGKVILQGMLHRIPRQRQLKIQECLNPVSYSCQFSGTVNALCKTIKKVLLYMCKRKCGLFFTALRYSQFDSHMDGTLGHVFDFNKVAVFTHSYNRPYLKEY